VSFRERLPQLSGDTFITDGGIETTLIFRDGFELPCFASFPLLDDEAGIKALRSYFVPYLEIAREHRVGLILDSATWRASSDWGAKLGYSPDALVDINQRAVALSEETRSEAPAGTTVVLSGTIGPRGDAYRPADVMSAEEAERYHAAQIATLADTAVDMVTALTLTTAAEAVGIVRAAVEVGLPAVISFTVETDGRLPDGQSLPDAIDEVDGATDRAAAYFMINCAHPSHFANALPPHGAFRERIRGLRANASSLSHAELDESETLDAGDPDSLAADYRSLLPSLPKLNVIGGCCGTDHTHVAALCDVWVWPD
jgi:S-methylmethionine-dependent homocysteine/selenocysteine methylase